MCTITYTPGPAPSQQWGSYKQTQCDGSGTPMIVADDMNVYDDGNPCTQKTCTMGTLSITNMIDAPCTVAGMSGFCELDPTGMSQHVLCLPCKPSDPSTCAAFPNTMCVKGECVPPHCTDMAKDNGETDVDCGGATSGCLKCPAMKMCGNGSTDCTSGVCTMAKCAVANCMDNVQNEDETGQDCGGNNCSPCSDGVTCLLPSDCVSRVCMPPNVDAGMAPGPNTCQAPTCTDGVQNGDETGVDCGGMMSMCPPCAM
jgi:hypothetical protein